MIKSRRMRWAGNLACMGQGAWGDAYKVMVGKPEGKGSVIGSCEDIMNFLRISLTAE
jgi:hypothetical protein